MKRITSRLHFGNIVRHSKTDIVYVVQQVALSKEGYFVGLPYEGEPVLLKESECELV